MTATKTAVRFEEVGPDKRTWTALLPSICWRTLYAEVKRQKALGSRAIDFEFDDDGQSGTIFVGLFRRVGRFTVLPAPAAPTTPTGGPLR